MGMAESLMYSSGQALRLPSFFLRETVYQKVLLKMRASVRANKIRFTIHALEEMNDDDLYKADIVHCISTGEIVHRQWDDSFQEDKYLVDGEILSGDMIEVVAKLEEDFTVVITAYVL